MMETQDQSGYVHHGRVAFYETDAARIVHFSNYLRYAEVAETEALSSCGLLEGMMAQQMMLPRVQLEVDYMQPLRFLEQYTVHAHVLRVGASSVQWGFEITGAAGLAARLRWVTARLDAQGRKAAYSQEERAMLSRFMPNE